MQKCHTSQSQKQSWARLKYFIFIHSLVISFRYSNIWILNSEVFSNPDVFSQSDVTLEEPCSSQTRTYGGRGRGRGGGMRGRGPNRQSDYDRFYYKAQAEDPNSLTSTPFDNYSDFAQEFTALSPLYSPVSEFVMPYLGSNYYTQTVDEGLLMELLKNQM